MEGMFFEICTVIALLVFIIIGYYVVQTLRALQQTLSHINHSVQELENKAQHLESTFKTIDNLGNMCQMETLQWRQKYLENKLYGRQQSEDYKEDLTLLILSGLKLASKLLRRK